MTKIHEKTAVINARDNIRGYVILSKGGVCKGQDSLYSVMAGRYFDNSAAANCYFNATFEKLEDAQECFSELSPEWSFADFSKYETR